jgi:hypothetical protein
MHGTGPGIVAMPYSDVKTALYSGDDMDRGEFRLCPDGEHRHRRQLTSMAC